MPVSLSSMTQIVRTVDVKTTISTTWLGVQDRSVSIITSNLGLAGTALMTGAVLGAATVWVIDQLFQKSRKQLIGDSYYCHEMFRAEQLSELDQLSPQEKNLKNRLRTIFTAILLPAGIIASSWNILGAVGFVLGAGAVEYYNKNSDRKIKEFVQELKQNSHINLRSQFDLSYYCGYLRYFNLNKLGNHIYEKFRNNYSLVLRGCRLTDADLIRLKEANWFSFFEALNVSDNPQITVKGLKCIGEAKRVKTLDLNRIDLTDDDLIQMAESGHFNDLASLSIRYNPQITGKSLIRMAQNGFENLNCLDLGGNPQLLGKGLDEWIEQTAFKKLGALGLSNCGIMENDLQQMIKRAEWFRNLSGLDLDNNTTLQKFPPNISQMTSIDIPNIGDHPGGIGYGGDRLRFDGKGIFFRGFSKEFTFTPEFKELCKARKMIIEFPKG